MPRYPTPRADCQTRRVAPSVAPRRAESRSRPARSSSLELDGYSDCVLSARRVIHVQFRGIFPFLVSFHRDRGRFPLLHFINLAEHIPFSDRDHRARGNSPEISVRLRTSFPFHGNRTIPQLFPNLELFPSAHIFFQYHSFLSSRVARPANFLMMKDLGTGSFSSHPYRYASRA